MAEYAEYWLLLAGPATQPQERESIVTESELESWAKLGEAERAAAEIRHYGRTYPPVVSASFDGSRPAARDKNRTEKA